MPKETFNIIITYDIAEPKRLNKIAKILKDYGIRVQKSIFEVKATYALFKAIKEKIETTIDGTESFE